MFRYMKKITPVISPMIASLFLFSSTISFAQAAQTTLANQKLPYLLKDSTYKQGPQALFDKDTDTRYVSSQSQLIERHFDKPVALDHMKIYGEGDYQLSVSYKVNGIWENSKAWHNVNLSDNHDGWNTYTLDRPVQTDTVRVALIPLSSSPKGIAEISFDTPSNLHATNTLILDQGKEKNANRIYQAILDTSDKTADKSFAFQSAYNPNQIQKAVLSYEVNGVSGSASVIRAINDEMAQGGLLLQPVSHTNKQVKVSEEINPEWLKTGLNKIKFFSHQGEMPDDYGIFNVKLTLTTTASDATKKPNLVAYAPQKSLSYKEFAYVRGFVQHAGEELSKITVDGQEIANDFGAFEALVKAKGKKRSILLQHSKTVLPLGKKLQ